MADFNNYQNRMAQTRAQSGAMIDEGLRAYMLKVYNLMALALVITGVAAFATFTLATTNEAFAQLLYASPLRWVVQVGTLAKLGPVDSRRSPKPFGGLEGMDPCDRRVSTKRWNQVERWARPTSCTVVSVRRALHTH